MAKIWTNYLQKLRANNKLTIMYKLLSDLYILFIYILLSNN